MKKSKEHYRTVRASTLKQGDVIYIAELELGKCVVDTVEVEQSGTMQIHLLTRLGPIYARPHVDTMLIVRVSK